VDLSPPVASLQEEALAGLARTPKQLPPKLFYDRCGSELFRAICGTDAYYLTRTEDEILRTAAAQIAAALGPGCVVLEPGAGDMHKIRLLLSALRPAGYIPFDLARDQLISAGSELARAFPWLEVVAAHADFSRSALRAVDPPGRGPRVLFFPGSTLGNFDPDEARAFLAQAREAVGPGGRALIGVDLVKDPAVLDRAYNDPEGLTAQFNLNLLARLNREMSADFDLAGFSHRAFYNAPASRIEMHLVSARHQTVTMAGHRFDFEPDETIHTENSHKYTPEAFLHLAKAAGLEPVRWWSDPRGWFGVFLLAA
jgi:dimethylhistidine N-methyltransferase